MTRGPGSNDRALSLFRQHSRLMVQASSVAGSALALAGVAALARAQTELLL